MRYLLFILIILYSNLLAININTIKTFKANFIQIVQNPSEKTLEYDGKIFIDGSNVLWEYQKPVIKQVYIKKDFAIVVEPELEQAIYTQIDQEINLFDLIKKAKVLEKDHYVTMVNQIEYHIFLKNEKINSVKYTDSLENQVQINFFNVKQNITIDQTLFSFKAPDHYDIIRK